MIQTISTTNFFFFNQEYEKNICLKELNDKDLKNRRRTLGNIQFLGELFKLKVILFISFLSFFNIFNAISRVGQTYPIFQRFVLKAPEIRYVCN